MKGLGNMLYSNTRTLNTFGFLVSLLIWVFAAGCAVEPGDTFDETGEYMGTVLETSEGAIRTRDNAAVDREGEYCHNCSTLCECGRIWHPAGWTINCDYWCAKIDGKGTSCGGGDDDAQEASFQRQTIESVAPATAKKDKLETKTKSKRSVAKGELIARGVNGCHSICGDMADGIICGPHACTPEAAGSCCPSDDDDEEREEEAADDESTSERVERVRQTERNSSLGRPGR
ncbi:MAG: hypothetical protein ACON3Z_15905 [Bradymonadia bacterium]